MNISTAAEEVEVSKRNFRYVQIDAVGVSIASIAAPFLPVFLTRLGASNFQVGLLTSMPGMAGLILALLVGRFLQTRRNIVPWYGLSRLMYLCCYGLTGILTLWVNEKFAILATLTIWAFATLPQITLDVAFSVVMNAIAGPEGRYTLLSRRWAIIGLTGVIGTFIVTRLIDLIEFPSNYAIMFMVLSLGGFLSYYFSRKIQVADQCAPLLPASRSTGQNLKNYLGLLRENPTFLSFSSKRFVYFFAIVLAQPILPLFLVREVGATDSQIGAVNMALTLVTLAGYFLWPRVSRRYGGRTALLATTLGLTFYPALSAATPQINLIIFYSGVAGLFQAGLNLVFFDELMKTIPTDYSATFVALAQSMQYLSMFLAPLLGTWIANYIGLGGALWLSASLRLLGFLLFLKPDLSGVLLHRVKHATNE